MDTPRNTAIKARLGNNKGFTLIEMAIVLVIIGIIIGAVVKGQDLIDSSKSKQVLTLPSKWEVPLYTYYDKKGYLPGASSTDGSIADFATLKTALTGQNIALPPDTVSGVTVDIKKLALVCAGTATRNIMLFTTVPLDYAKQLDISIDGSEDGLKGKIRYCGAAGLTAEAAWPTTDPVSVVYFFDKGK